MAVKGAKALEVWARRVTEGYPGVRVRDMTSSWRNGLAFCAILHRFRPDLIDFDSLDPEQIERNCALVFRTAEEVLGIPALLDPADMAAQLSPDRLSILTYLSEFYHKFKAEKSPSGSPAPAKKTEDTPASSVSVRTSPDVSVRTCPDVLVKTSPDVRTCPDVRMKTEDTPASSVSLRTYPDVSMRTSTDLRTSPDMSMKTCPDVNVRTCPDVTIKTCPDVNVRTCSDLRRKDSCDSGVSVSPLVSPLGSVCNSPPHTRRDLVPGISKASPSPSTPSSSSTIIPSSSVCSSPSYTRSDSTLFTSTPKQKTKNLEQPSCRPLIPDIPKVSPSPPPPSSSPPSSSPPPPSSSSPPPSSSLSMSDSPVTSETGLDNLLRQRLRISLDSSLSSKSCLDSSQIQRKSLLQSMISAADSNASMASLTDPQIGGGSRSCPGVTVTGVLSTNQSPVSGSRDLSRPITVQCSSPSTNQSPVSCSRDLSRPITVQCSSLGVPDAKTSRRHSLDPGGVMDSGDQERKPGRGRVSELSASFDLGSSGSKFVSKTRISLSASNHIRYSPNNSVTCDIKTNAPLSLREKSSSSSTRMPQTEESTLTASLTNKEASQDLNCNVKSVTDNSDNSFKTRMMKFESMMRPGISSQGNNITKTLRNTNQEARNHFPASDPSRPIRRQASGHVTPLDQSEARHHDRRKTISFPASFALSMTDTGQDSRLTF